MKPSLSCVLFALVPLSSCASDPAPLDEEGGGDFIGIEEASEGLTDLSNECSFVSGTGVLTVALGTGDIAMIAKSSTGAMTINGYPCAGATGTTMKRLVVTGTAGAQTLILDFFGGTFGQGLTAGGGIDVDLSGGTDALKIRGTKSADTFVFGATGITFNADTFKDITYAGVETYVVTMSDGNDVFSGAGSATVGGAFAADVTVYGGEGNDTLRGGDGDDTLDGGNGADTFTAGAAVDGDDTMTGGAGVDIADYSARTAALSLSVDATANDGLSGEADDIGSDIETIKGGTAADTIVGSSAAETIFGGAGDDVITGGGGADVLNGDAGNDTFDEGAATSGADTFNGGAGTDTVSYGSRTVAVVVLVDGTARSGQASETDKVMTDVENVTGGDGNDTITGSAVDNVLDGGDGDDTVNGGLGNDTLVGGAGANTLNGDGGDDTFAQGAAADGDDAMHGGAGLDRVDYGSRTNAVTATLDAASSSGESGEADTIYNDVENMTGGAGDDTLTGNAFDNQLAGGLGDDTLFGLAGDDILDGDAGSDALDCGAGDGDIALDATTASSTGCEL